MKEIKLSKEQLAEMKYAKLRKNLTQPHRQYFSPDVDEIVNYAKLNKVELNGGNVDTIKNMCNVFSYADFNEDPMDSLLAPSKWDDDFENSKIDNEVFDKCKNEQEFLKTIDYNKVPGNGPLDKAFNVIKYLNSLNKGPKLNVEMSGKLNRDCLNILKISDFEKEALQLEGETPDLLCKINEANLNLIVHIGGILKQIAQFKTGGITKKIFTEHGKKAKFTKMTDFSQINKVSSFEMVNPMFDYKLATKDLSIKRKFENKDFKQVLYMLVDTSGSMSNEVKISTVNATLLNRLISVANEEAVLYFSFYESHKYDEFVITNKKEALQFFNKVRSHRYSKGGTNIGGVLAETIVRINQLEGVKPQIMIVCDGEDHCDSTLDNQGVVINAIIIGAVNENLKNICIKSGGQFIDMPYDIEKLDINDILNRSLNQTVEECSFSEDDI